jgi:hypothetical protein
MGIVGSIFLFISGLPACERNLQPSIQMVTAYIGARPQRSQERFIDLATEALQDAWPCKPNLK